MLRSLAAGVLVLACCGKHRDHVTASARDTVPITITTSYPGASPAVVAESVTTPIERQLGQMAHLEALHSRSSDGRSVVIAEFASGTNLDVASQEVQKALNATSTLLPQDLPTPPTYTRASRKGAVMRLTVASKTTSLVDVAHIARHILAQKLAQVAGAGEVDVCGPEAETRITLDPAALAARGKTIADVRSAIAGASVAVPGGSLDLGGRNLSVKTGDDAIAAYRELPIVRDTARVETGASGPSCVAIATGGARVVAVTVIPQVGAEPLEVRERLEALVPSLQASLPVDIHLDVWPRTRPLAYEILLGSGMSVPARIDRLERALRELHLATRSLVQFGGAEREPDVADLRIAPSGEDAKDIAQDVVPTFERLHLAIRDPRDHVVGFTGQDAAALRKQTAALVTALAPVKTLTVVEQIGADDQPRPVVTIDRDRAAALGIAASEIAATLRVLAPGGMWVATMFTQVSEERVMLAVDGEFPNVLDQVMVRSTSGSLLPLSTVATVTETREPTVIFHEGQVPWVGVRVAGPLDALQDVLAKLPVPAGVQRALREPD